MSASCSDMEFSIYGEEGGDMAEGVEKIKYMGKTLYQKDDDWPEVRQNIRCARSVWGVLGTLLIW